VDQKDESQEDTMSKTKRRKKNVDYWPQALAGGFADAAEQQTAWEEIERLSAIVDRLPHDAKGEPLTPGEHRMYTHHDGRREEVVVDSISDVLELVVGGLPGINDECWEVLAEDLEPMEE
jgi:hypothetical protein